MKNYMPIEGQFFMRKQRVNGVDVTVVIGIIPQDLITTKIEAGSFKGGPGDELWRMMFVPVDVQKYRVPPEYAGYRADQILCEGPRLDECEGI